MATDTGTWTRRMREEGKGQHEKAESKTCRKVNRIRYKSEEE